MGRIGNPSHENNGSRFHHPGGQTMSTNARDCEGFYRRDFLKFGAAGLMGLGLADLLRLEAVAARKDATKKKKANAVIMVWLGGGPATIDMWDLKPNAPEGIRG